MLVFFSFTKRRCMERDGDLCAIFHSLLSLSFLSTQYCPGPVVRRLDNAIHWTNRYPLNKSLSSG